MSESGEGGMRIPKRTWAAAAVIAAGSLFGMYRGGSFDELPKDHPNHEIGNPNQELIGKPIINGQAINEKGELELISGAVINPATQKVEAQLYQAKLSGEPSGIRAFKVPDASTEPLDLSELGINTTATFNAQPVYGEVYGDESNPDNVLGNSEPLRGVHTGSYLKIISDTAQGIDIYVPTTNAIVLEPITVHAIDH